MGPYLGYLIPPGPSPTLPIQTEIHGSKKWVTYCTVRVHGVGLGRKSLDGTIPGLLDPPWSQPRPIRTDRDTWVQKWVTYCTVRVHGVGLGRKSLDGTIPGLLDPPWPQPRPAHTRSAMKVLKLGPLRVSMGWGWDQG